MENLDLLFKLMHAKNELELVRQRTRQKHIRLCRNEWHMSREDFDPKDPPRGKPWRLTTCDKVRPDPYLVPLKWIKMSRSERNYQLRKAKTEAMVAALAIHDFTRKYGKTIRDLMKKEGIEVHRCRYNHYYENVYLVRPAKDTWGRQWIARGRKEIEQRALKIVAEQFLIGGEDGEEAR